MPIEVHMADDSFIYNKAFANLLKENGLESADKLYGLSSTDVKSEVSGRNTGKVFLRSGEVDIEVFIKRYQPVSFEEKVKLFFYNKPKSSDAFDEWNSILKFHDIGLSTMEPIAVAQSGDNSCNLTLGIQNYIRAKEYFEEEKSLLSRKEVIEKLGIYIGILHKNNMAHQDLYLVHFFLKIDEGLNPYLIDLQRVIIQSKLSMRWQIKDLGQFVFSCNELLSKDELNVFWKEYFSQINLSESVSSKIRFLSEKKAQKIFLRDQRKSKRVSQ